MQYLKRFVPTISPSAARWVLVGALAGVVFFGLIRFVWQPSETVHYHANFAVFVGGKRVDFNSPHYYQEIASCSSTANPQGRVHMHDNVSDVVHVHADLVTWANFFSILGWSLQDELLFDGQRTYHDDENGKLRFVLNSQPVLSIANEVIKSEDRLLISFGNESAAELQKQYEQIAHNADRYNQTKDPAACRGPEEDSIWRRLQRALWF